MKCLNCGYDFKDIYSPETGLCYDCYRELAFEGGDKSDKH